MRNRNSRVKPPYSTPLKLVAALSIPLHVTAGASSDNKSFMAAGFPTAAISEEWDHDDLTPHLHRETDIYETVDFDYLASTTELALAVMRRLAEK